MALAFVVFDRHEQPDRANQPGPSGVRTVVAVRFYLGADLLGVATILAAVRSAVTYPVDAGGSRSNGFERPPCPVQLA